MRLVFLARLFYCSEIESMKLQMTQFAERMRADFCRSRGQAQVLHAEASAAADEPARLCALCIRSLCYCMILRDRSAVRCGKLALAHAARLSVGRELTDEIGRQSASSAGSESRRLACAESYGNCFCAGRRKSFGGRHRFLRLSAGGLAEAACRRARESKSGRDCGAEAGSDSGHEIDQPARNGERAGSHRLAGVSSRILIPLRR